MQANERRFRQRYRATQLTLEIHRIRWLRGPSQPSPATASNFALGGIGIITTRKIKPGKRLLLDLASSDHCLRGIPAVVLRCEPQGREFFCALQFTLDELPAAASQAAYTVLQRIESTLISKAQSDTTQGKDSE